MMSKVSKVNTVAGLISPSELGKTLMHEHIQFGFGGWYANGTITPYNREACVKIALGFIEELKAYGIKTIIDATPNDCGRDPELLKEISETSEINIICSTGLYSEADGAPGYFKFRNMVTGNATGEILELFMEEITHGIGTTGIKPGVIKVGTSNGEITPYEERILRAAARAQKETGIPILTHTSGASSMGVEQVDLLVSESADPKQIVIGHMGGTGDIQYHLTIIKKGVFIAFDRLGLPIYGNDELNTACVIGLIGIGYEHQIMLSQDNVWYFLGKTPIDVRPGYIFNDFIPALKKVGVTDDKINTIISKNPERLFAG
jgi:phosphotriesterase-related protein